MATPPPPPANSFPDLTKKLGELLRDSAKCYLAQLMEHELAVVMSNFLTNLSAKIAEFRPSR